jgi:hypothetical protein
MHRSFPPNTGANLISFSQRDDIFPIIETEDLVKFRISYLRTQTWEENCLLEYFTIALKYQDDGRYELDVWRAGTGKQHVANTDSQLWNLGDYLSRLPSRTGPNPSTTTDLARLLTFLEQDLSIGLWHSMLQTGLMTLPLVSGSLIAPISTTPTSAFSNGMDMRMRGLQALSP